MLTRSAAERLLAHYQRQGYSVRYMSQLLHCSRFVVRRMLDADWSHPAVQALLHQPTTTPPISRKTAASSDLPPVSSARAPHPHRVAFNDAYHQTTR